MVAKLARALLTFSLVLSAACGLHNSGSGAGQGGGLGDSSGPPINWATPLHAGQIIASLSDAQKLLPFTIVTPAFAQAPSLIQVDDPNQVQPQDRLLAMVYTFQAYGAIVVEEKSSQFLLADLQKRAEAVGNIPGEFTMVPIRGTQGLLVAGSGVGRLMWIENGVLFDIKGPSVSPAGVQALAAAL